MADKRSALGIPIKAKRRDSRQVLIYFDRAYFDEYILDKRVSLQCHLRQKV